MYVCKQGNGIHAACTDIKQEGCHLPKLPHALWTALTHLQVALLLSRQLTVPQSNSVEGMVVLSVMTLVKDLPIKHHVSTN